MTGKTDLALASATELMDLYRSGGASPVEAVQAAVDRYERFEESVNAFVHFDAEGALSAAKASEERWRKGEPLGLVDGVPATIKDLVLMKGVPTRRGSLTSDTAPAVEDAPVTARLREHGAVLLGKTTTPEFGWKPLTDSPLTGITRNPWNTSRTPGGSSGGAASACALGIGALHIGTDGGGSIRIPAAFSGIFGIKQTFGLVPAYPLSPMGTVAHVGPMTRTVTDSALMLNVITQPDIRDWYAVTDGAEDYTETLGAGVAQMRIAFSMDLGYAKVMPDVQAKVRAAVKVFEDLGATVEEVDPGFACPDVTFNTHWYAGAASISRNFTDKQMAMIDPGLREVMYTGRTYPLFHYMDVTKQREDLAYHMAKFHETYDLLLTPMMPVTAVSVDNVLPAPDMSNWLDWTPFSYPFNLTQQPAATVPCGFGDDGLPVGLQIVGPKFADNLVLTAAKAFENVCPFVMPDAPNVTHGS
ncbi:amidase [Hwanghaeella grinnelliae]|uniref:Amidase n=1 Tax=Hwanghaeella grinnelliae TaxID=2500179 RepID=A0A3S2W2Z5_9PROT|nr:amidase [Hwanghaeella grinnelliae]RVU34786.1 amidase [Hwanghaeella grinnelliae]